MIAVHQVQQSGTSPRHSPRGEIQVIADTKGVSEILCDIGKEMQEDVKHYKDIHEHYQNII